MTTLFQSHKKTPPPATRIKVTARISVTAHEAINELQRRHRRQTGKALRLWEVLDAAVITYAKANGIKIRS